MNSILQKVAHVLRQRFSAPQPAPDIFSMQASVQRIAAHGISLKSVIDIGASSGIWSRGAIKIFSEAFFLAIEPLAEREGALKSLRQEYPNFDYALCAAGENNDQPATLNITEDLDGSTINGRNGILQREIPVKTIDALVAEKQLPGPFLLKFDTHGYEVPILTGAQKTLAATNIIIMEVYNYNFTDHNLKFYEMCSFLERLGFSCYDMADPMLRSYDSAFWQMDLFFSRKDLSLFSYSQYK